jgi:aspartyl-tRNA(Asn)/glutamyl-tRNA(Gln) amidotransferase subunit A
MYMSDMYTIPSSLAGLPWISIPCWFTESEDEEKELLPVWLQIVTPYMKEESLFEIANVYQTNTPWHTKNPEWFED